MKSKKRRTLLVLLAAVLAVSFQLVGDHYSMVNTVYGSSIYVKSKVIEKPSTVQGDENVIVVIEIENMSNENFTFNSAELKVDKPGNVTVLGGTTGSTTLVKGGKTTVSFYLNIGRYAETGSRYLNLILRDNGTVVHENLSLGSFSIRAKLAAPGNSGTQVAALDMVHYINPEGGFDSGQDNTLAIEIRNNGNTIVKNAELSLLIPDGLSIYNASNSANLGYISVGSSREVSFPISVDDEAKAKTYEVIARLTGLDYTNQGVSVEKTFYVPVKGSGASIKNTEITSISIPSEVTGQDEFILSFEVHNNNSSDLKNVNINVDIPEGLLNKTRSTFIESVIPAKSRQSYSVTLFADDGAKERSYPIKISLSPITSSSSADDVIQYASVYLKGTSGSKTPQLMVDSYNYGGTFVQAGDRFVLCLDLYNTSGTHTLSNIKMSLSSEDGTFIPVNSSNSFYIETLGKKEHTEQYLHLSVKPTADQKTTALNVNMSYEDGSGNTFTSEDIISIPVMQETRLEVDDIIAPPELYAMMQSWVSMQFYNTGKTTLNNLRVSAEGDFDTTESTSYFVGNMESGTSDSYDFSFIPRSGGTMEGKVIFTYEDAWGDEQIIERPFSFQVMEEMPVFDPGMMPEDLDGGGSSNKLPWILAGIAILIIGGGIIAWKKLRKKKIQQEMEIDE